MRPEPTDRQRAYAADLGIEVVDGVDGVELGERIERAQAARDADRSQRRTARRSERSAGPRRTVVEARRLAEAAAFPSLGRIRNCLNCGAPDRGAECHCESCGWSEPGCPHTTPS